MRVTHQIALLAGALACMLAASAAQAQTQPKMKMTTEIPAGIAMPDKVDTRLGTLKFFDGFPDDASVEKLYDNLDFQRAVQVYLLGMAPVNQVANRKGIREVGPDNTTVPIFDTMMNARSIFLTPNNNTPYTWFWVDLHNGPLVVEVPPKVLGLMDDMWFYFGPKPPKGKENNWVQTVPGKGWNTLLRLYGPLQPWFDKTWRPGEIELID